MTSNTPGPWYTLSKPDDPQGLIYDESTGKNIATSYDPKHAPLIAAAPETAAERDKLKEINAELLAALEWCLPYIEAYQEGFDRKTADAEVKTAQRQFDAEWSTARAALAKARVEG